MNGTAARTSPGRPLRVLMVLRLFDPWVGGTQRQAKLLARELMDRGVSVRIVTGWWFRGTPQRETIDGIPVFRNHTLWEGFGIKGARKFGGYLYILTLLWHLWRHRDTYDVIHVHGLSYHTFAAALAGRWLRKPTITKLANSGRASDIDKMRRGQHLAFSHLMLPTALRCDRFVAVNLAVVRELLAAGVPGDRIVQIRNGIDASTLEAKETYELHDPVRLVFVGRLHEQKGLDTLLRSFRQVREEEPTTRAALRLIGDGPLREELVTLSGRLGISSDVEFAGNRDDVARLLPEADVFVLPSRAEGLSNALLEAMSAGLPVVVSKIPGNTDVISGGIDGLFFEPEDQGSLAAALSALLDGVGLRERLGRQARQTVEERYAIDGVACRYLELYEALTGITGTRRAGAPPPSASPRRIPRPVSPSR